MLHDLLLALYGVPGAVFVASAAETDAVSGETPDLDTKLVPVADSLPFIPHGELSLYGELVRFGSCYRALERFIQLHAGPHGSLYLSALACGLDDALEVYRDSLVGLESEVISDPDLNIAHFTYRLHSFKFILPILSDLVKKLGNAGKSNGRIVTSLGCRLIDVLVDAAAPGLRAVRTVIRKLLMHTLRIFYRQLYTWLICGVLHDPHEEFFIQHISGVIENTTPECSKAEHYFSQDKKPFRLVPDRVPSFLPMAIAEHILFTGEAINMCFHELSKSSLLDELEARFGGQFNLLIADLQNSTKEFDEDGIGMASLLDFSPLMSLLTEIHTFVSRCVWHSFVKEHNMLGYLCSIKDIVLLGRGEFFSSFVGQLNSLSYLNSTCSGLSGLPISAFRCGLLDRPPPSDEAELRAIEYDIKAAFLAAARSTGLDDDQLDDQFRFVLHVDSPQSDSVTESQILWDCLHLEVVFPPVLRMVFSQQVCRGYDRLFRYLSTIRRTQLVLQQYWAELTALWRSSYSSNRFPGTMQDKQLISVFQSTINRRLLMRNYMAFFLENLQYYLQVDVIESQLRHLMDRIQSDQEAYSVLAVHEAYVAGLQAQTLLFHPTANPCIMRLLSICRQFVSAASSSSADPYHGLSTLEERLFFEFQQLLLSLFRCLSSSESAGAKSGVGLEFGAKWSGHPSDSEADLNQLLLRLNFNHFLSGANGSLQTSRPLEIEHQQVDLGQP